MPTIEARITQVVRDGDWIRITTDHPTIGTEQNPLSTKRQEKGSEAFALSKSGERVVIQYNSRPKTLADGRTFQNYYYESAMTATNGGSAGLGEIPEAAPRSSGGGSSPDPNKDWRIALQVGAKLALLTMPMMAEHEQTFEVQTEIALAWGHWLYMKGLTLPEPDSSFGVTPASGRGAYSEPNLPPEEEFGF